jgi:fructose-1,6-bisphosphatase II
MDLARVTEAAALAAGRWMGRGDKEAADQAAVDAMRLVLNTVAMDGIVVIGEGEKDEAPMLFNGEEIGAGGPACDIAVDPIDGTTLTSLGRNNAIAVIAISERGTMFDPGPCVYMEKIAVGPESADAIDLDSPVKANLEAVAKAKGEQVKDVTAAILDRDRHADIIRECREAGARIKLIPDGDVTASISAAIRGTNDHLAIGIGGTRQAVLSAAALRCLGGELQAQFWPTSRREIDELRDLGIDDYTRIYGTEDLASGEVIVAATGVSNGDLLRGVRFLADSARTHSLLMCTRCNWVRFVDGIHFFARERREEVRLLGF